MKALLQLLEYNFWANDQFITRLQDQPDLNLQIDKLMSHVLSAHRVWLQRISGRGSRPSAWDMVDSQSWESINLELYHETSHLVKSSDLLQKITYQNSQGTVYENSVEEIIYHLINHSTHHRAQIAVLMRQSEILPPVSDYIFYLRN